MSGLLYECQLAFSVLLIYHLSLFRRKEALIWEVRLLARNAKAYNKKNSRIVKNGKIVVQTLMKFIRLTSYQSVRLADDGFSMSQ